MAAKSRGQGLERVLRKLNCSIDNGNYYEAHQMYRTLYFRYVGQKKYDEVLELLFDGSLLLLRHKQLTSGADLANLLVDVLQKAEESVTEDYIEKLARLYGFMEADSPERLEFLASALRWSSREGENSRRGHPRLHQLVALTLWKEKNYAQSRYHFIHSTDGDGCASMLIEYNVNKGYPSEADLFIAQAVLQYLCLKNKSTATVAFYAYTEKHPSVVSGPPFILPLLNFVWFLLLAIENGKLAVFTVLCEQYEPSIKRDPTYPEYLDRIGQLFFGLPPPPPKHSGIVGNFLQSFLGGLDDDDSGRDAEMPGPSQKLQSVQHDELD